MKWFLISFIATFLWAIVNIVDNYLVSNFSEKEKERSSGGLVLFSSLIGLFIATVISIFVNNIFDIPILDIILLFITGILTIVWVIFYLFTLEIEETSSVVPWFLAVPIFGYILGYFCLGETLTLNQILGSIIIIFGLVILSINFSGIGKKVKIKPILYMIFCCLIIAISGVIFKFVTIDGNFWVSSFWEYFGLGITGLFIFIFIPKYRREFMHMNSKGGIKIFFLNVGSEILTVSGNLLANFALLLVPVTMVFLVESFQPAIVLCLTIFCTKFLPKIAKENLSKRILIPKLIAILIMIFGSLILFL
ncbi:MAG TPA: EamA family transporter [Candidatus Paceibacterota bacterium]|nr:EamA family transporter [Candidatus Paceibacterota bacterium]HPT18081.1 EamA family transporter [Candidatus Paceibacterota bacterium]